MSNRKRRKKGGTHSTHPVARREVGAASTPENLPPPTPSPRDEQPPTPASLACIVPREHPLEVDLDDWSMGRRSRRWNTRRFNRWPTNAVGSWAWRQAARCTRAATLPLRMLFRARAEAWLLAQFEDGFWPSRQLRVGVSDQALLAILGPTLPACEVQWVAVPAQPGPLESRIFDAVVSRSEEGEIRVATPEAPGRDAAWHNPATARPITFSTLFPGRVDFAEAAFPADAAGAELQLLRTFIETAAAFSRHPSRLTLDDRFCGRLAYIHAEVATRVPHSRDPFQNVQRMLVIELGAALERQEGPTTPLRRAVARLVSAYLAGSDDEFPDALRHALLERCVVAAPDEPEVLLRAAAGRVAAYADDTAIEAIVRGEAALRDHPLAARTDQTPFLQAELQMGQGTPVSLGRVAAGIALVCSGLDNARAEIVRDDLLDEARFSHWMIPREQDRRFVMGVFRAILTARRDDRFRRARAA